MSADILDMVKGGVSDQIMSQIGGLLGQKDTKKTSSIFETAAQSILGGLIKKASSPQGAKDVFKSVQDNDDRVLDKLGDLLGGGKDSDLTETGGGILDNVFGQDQSPGIIDLIAKFLGLDKSMVGKLMKLAAPIVMGVIGKYVKNKALDAVGLGSLLGEQKSHLSKAMPSALTEQLGFGNLLSGAGDAGRAATGAEEDAASAGGSLLKFLLPLILLGGLAWLGYSMLTRGGANAGDGGDAPAISMPEFEGVDFGDFDIGGMKSKFDGITDGFKNVTADNAGGLATKIENLTGSVGNMGIENLSGAAKTAVSGVIGKFIDSITDSLNGLSDDGIMGILKPAVNALIEKLNQFK